MAGRTQQFLALLGVAALLTAAGCSGDDNGDTGDTGEQGKFCAEYCSLVMKNCTDDNVVYVSEGVCKSACAKFPDGAREDTSGNTAGCRLYHAGAAAMDATTHCPHAGPGGAGYCGVNCEGYCSLVLGTCVSLYADANECKMECEGFRDEEPFKATILTGNTVQCRLYHASVATTDLAHCDHVGVNPAPGTCDDTKQ